MICALIRLSFCLALLSACVFAQRPPDIKLDAAANRQVVGGVIRAINKYYVSTDIAKRLDERLRQRLKNGDYDKITSAFDLIDALDDHMQEVSKDQHLKLAYSHTPEPLVEGKDFSPETLQEREESLKLARARNFGFEKVERLPGNIGYLEMTSFVRPSFSGETAGMVIFLASYFFDDEPFRLGDWYTRVENDTLQRLWTYAYLPGSRYLNKDVYILLSRRSFSAVEGFASILQHHQRALIVGEPTRGGTHLGRMVRVHPHFAVFVPRCGHFHLLAVSPGYKPLVTEIHFKDDPKKNDPMYRAENAIAVEKRTINGVSFETGVFDIVLERETNSK